MSPAQSSSTPVVFFSDAGAAHQGAQAPAQVPQGAPQDAQSQSRATSLDPTQHQVMQQQMIQASMAPPSQGPLYYNDIPPEVCFVAARPEPWAAPDVERLAVRRQGTGSGPGRSPQDRRREGDPRGTRGGQHRLVLGLQMFRIDNQT